MQIILMEKVANLGQLGEVVNVKNGYARNFLIPQGKAKRATEAAIVEFEAKRAELEKKQTDLLAAAAESLCRWKTVRFGYQRRYRRGTEGSGFRSRAGNDTYA